MERRKARSLREEMPCVEVFCIRHAGGRDARRLRCATRRSTPLTDEGTEASPQAGHPDGATRRRNFSTDVSASFSNNRTGGALHDFRHRHARACRGHPRLASVYLLRKPWMAGTSPAMTNGELLPGSRIVARANALRSSGTRVRTTAARCAPGSYRGAAHQVARRAQSRSEPASRRSDGAAAVGDLRGEHRALARDRHRQPTARQQQPLAYPAAKWPAGKPAAPQSALGAAVRRPSAQAPEVRQESPRALARSGSQQAFAQA